MQSFLFYSFISIISVPLALSKQLTWENFLVFVSIGVTITTIIGIFCYLVSRLTNSYQKTLNVKQQQIFTLTLIAVVGVLRGYLLYFSTNLGGFNQPTSLLARLISSTATTVFWLTLFSIIVEDTKVFRNRYKNLVRSSILRLAQVNSSHESSQLSSRIHGEISEIEALLSKTFDEATQSAMNHKTMVLAAEQVRRTVEENIRPLSHRLWLRSASSLPSIRIFGAITAGLKNLSVQPVVPGALLALTSVFNLSSTFGWHRGLYGSFFIFFVYFLFYRYALQMIKNRSSGFLFLNILITFIPGFILSVIFFLSNKYIFNDDSGLLNFIYIVIFFLVACFSSTYTLTQSDRNHLISLMETNLLPSKIDDDEDSFVNESMASYLHNSLQSELLALSYQIEESAKDPNAENSRRLLEKLGSRINRSISDDFENFVERPLDRLSRIQTGWKGIAAISIEIPDHLLLDANRNFLIVQIIEEAITNAVRFSKSSEVNIVGRETLSGEIYIVIRNNGEAEQQTTTGMGTEWLDRFAAGNWTRTLSEKGTTLEITL